MKRIIPVVLLLALFGVGYWYLELHPGTDLSDPNELRLSGNVEVTRVRVSFRIPGRMTDRFVDEGDSVRQGALVAQLDPRDEELAAGKARADLQRAEARLRELENGSRSQEIKEAQAAVKQARADAQKALAELKQAEADFIRYRDLHARKVVSAHDAEIHRTSFKSAQSMYELAQARIRSARQVLSLKKEGFRVEQIEQARAEVAAGKETLREAEQRLEYTSLFCPLTGTVLTKAAEPGEYVNPGSPVIAVADLDDVWLRAFVPERELGRLHLGQEAVVTTDAYPDREFRGRVTFIASEPEFTPKQVQTFEERVKLVYRVKISLDNPDLLLKPGMPADARIRYASYSGPEAGK